MVFLQALGYFVRTGSVSGCFHHTDHLCFRMAKHGTVMVQIGDHRSEVYFKNGFMYLQFKFFGYQIKVEHARTFYQNYFRMKWFEYAGRKKCFCVRKEVAFEIVIKTSGTGGYFLPYTNQFIYSFTLHQLCYTPVERSGTLSGFQYIRQNQCPLQAFLFRTTYQKVECNIQWCQVWIITIINQYAVILSFFHFQTHGNRFETGHPFGDLVGRCHQVKTSCQAIQHIFNGSVIDERNTECIIHFQITIGYNSMIFFLDYTADIQRTFNIPTAPGYFTCSQHWFCDTITD